MTEVRVYDDERNEIWLAHVAPGQVAVRYKDFKTGLPRRPDGQLVKTSEICRIFSTLEEARADARAVVAAHWVVRCLIYDHTGAEIDAVSNNRELGKFAAAAFGGAILWLAIFISGGMAMLWILSAALRWALRPFPAARDLFSISGALGWVLYAIGGLLLSGAVVFVRLGFRVDARAREIIRRIEKRREISDSSTTG